MRHCTERQTRVSEQRPKYDIGFPMSFHGCGFKSCRITSVCLGLWSFPAICGDLLGEGGCLHDKDLKFCLMYGKDPFLKLPYRFARMPAPSCLLSCWAYGSEF